MNGNHILAAVTGLAIIACFATLGAIHVITGDQALTGISTVTGFLFGAGGVAIGVNVASNPTPPAPPATPIPAPAPAPAVVSPSAVA